jgi:hypothetical protein
LCNILFQVGELKFGLIDERATFRRLSELLVSQLLDRVFFEEPAYGKAAIAMIPLNRLF